MIRESIERVNLNEAFQFEVNTAVVGLTILEEVDPANMNEGINDILKKFGFEVEHKAPGVIEYLARFTKGVGLMIWYAIKGDKKKVSELVNKFDKDEVIDFLYKLDLVTMHLITGPLHLIDGLTGWELVPYFKELGKKAEDAITKIKKALSTLKATVTKFFNPNVQPLVLGHVTDIEKLIQGN